MTARARERHPAEAGRPGAVEKRSPDAIGPSAGPITRAVCHTMRTIMHDRRLHFLVPFALPSAADAASSLHTLDSPALEKLLARASLVERVAGEDFQRTLPHERWLARQFGASRGNAADEAPLAPYMLLADGGDPGTHAWACVEPVHVQIAHDHLVLVDPASLALDDGDAAALLAVARPLIEELGVRLEAPQPTRWYLSSEQLARLAGAAPLRASGRNIEIWLPHEAHTGERSRMWMKLQNEVQMAWFQHPVNEAREARGLPAVNSIWFHAQGTLKPVGKPFERVLSASPRRSASRAPRRPRPVPRRPPSVRCPPPPARRSSSCRRCPLRSSNRTGHAGTTRSPCSSATGSRRPSPRCRTASWPASISRCAGIPAP